MDTSLVVRSQRGDDAAFTDLSLSIGPRLLDIAFSILRERPLAEDATQQALLQIWRKLPRLRDPAKFEAWSYRVLVRACYAEARRIPRWMSDEAVQSDRQPVGADVYGAVADRDQLERGFRRLPVDHRVVIVLHHLLDLTLDETAEVLGIPVGTVRSRLYYAMAGLRAALEADARPVTRPFAVPGEAAR
jgi:RNA polymerase sigma-70 factor (ECF subfamily)